MIDRRTDYALRTLIYLAGKPEGGRLSATDLGKVLHISPVFLSKILQTLARHKIIGATRGRGGGVRLKEKNVSIGKVIRIMDPAFSLARCLDTKFYCAFKKACPLHRALKELDKELFSKLSGITISKLISRRR